MTLTKNDIVELVSEKLGFSKKHSAKAVETLLEIIKATLEAGDDVLVSSFGKFCLNDKKERIGRNPATGETLMLKPRRVVTFKSSGKLRNRVNGK